MKSLPDCRLYTFVDTAYLHGQAPGDIAQALCDGGSDVIQLRAKNEAAEVVRRMAGAILPITQAAGVWLVINDHPEIAREIGADLCHLGQEDFFDPGGYKSRHGGNATGIGLSTHAPEQAERALAAQPEYIAIGPVYPTGTKPTARAVGLEYIRWAAANVPIPWFAIGGIKLGNLNEVLGAGARRICVVSAILNASDVTKACSQFRHRLF